MTQKNRCDVGPIRPPSESFSLLIRVTRNCPWNKCLFCPVYKAAKFEKRAEASVMAEIDQLASAAKKVREIAGISDDETEISQGAFQHIAHNHALSYDMRRVALWMHRGGRHVFLQDADSLIIPAHRVVRILKHLYACFPQIDRVTTYARSRTLVTKTKEQLAALRSAGLTRIHVGLESGSDQVLSMVKKGCRAEHHIEGISKTKDAGFEVCCYVMPGLGGKELSKAHVRGTAKALRAIEPQHIRLRTMFLTEGMPLYEKVKSGELILLEEDEVVEEIRDLIRKLKGIDSHVVSDHDHNLLFDIKGHLTNDADKLEENLARFLDLEKAHRDSFIVARRLGHLRSVDAFLKDDAYQTRYLPVVEELKAAGEGSLLMGMLSRFTPRLF